MFILDRIYKRHNNSSAQAKAFIQWLSSAFIKVQPHFLIKCPPSYFHLPDQIFSEIKLSHRQNSASICEGSDVHTHCFKHRLST